jgi:hypothetical protein
VTADVLAYFHGEVVGNMREQEALLFSAANRDQCAALERTLREHDQKIATARRLVEALAIGAPSGGLLREVARVAPGLRDPLQRTWVFGSSRAWARGERSTPTRGSVVFHDDASVVAK